MVAAGLLVNICFHVRVFRMQNLKMTAPSVRKTPVTARHTRRRMRLREDFENSVLASRLAGEESVRSVQPTQPKVHVKPVMPKSPIKKADKQNLPVRPFMASGHDHLDDWINEASRLSRAARYAAILGAVALAVACALVVTKGLAGAVWEFLARG